MTQLSSKTLFQTDPWNTYTQIKFMSIQKGKKGCARSSFRFVRTPVLPKFYILSDKEGFAIQLWFKSVKENTNHALCFTALDNSLLYSAFLDDGFLPLIIENKTREINSVNCYIWGKETIKMKLTACFGEVVCLKNCKSYIISVKDVEVSKGTACIKIIDIIKCIILFLSS